MKDNDCRDQTKTINKDGEIQIPAGHFALLNSHESSNNGASKFAIYGLGSCIALLLYDKNKKISAMSHILLSKIRETRRSNPLFYPHKYAESSVRHLLDEMLKHGASRKRIKAVITGGADIFGNNILAVGKANIEEVKDQLEKLNIKLEKEITGGRRGRVVIYNSIDNSLSVKVTGTEAFKKIALQ